MEYTFCSILLKFLSFFSSYLGIDQIGRNMIMVMNEIETGDGLNLQNKMIEDKVGDRINTDRCKETTIHVINITIVIITIIEEMIEIFTTTEGKETLMILEIGILTMRKKKTDIINHKEGKNGYCTIFNVI
jgi:hypothetical protein